MYVIYLQYNSSSLFSLSLELSFLQNTCNAISTYAFGDKSDIQNKYKSIRYTYSSLSGLQFHLTSLVMYMPALYMTSKLVFENFDLCVSTCLLIFSILHIYAIISSNCKTLACCEAEGLLCQAAAYRLYYMFIRYSLYM